MEDVQEMVRLDPSVIILSDLGCVEIIDMADEIITCMQKSKMKYCTFSIFYVTSTFSQTQTFISNNCVDVSHSSESHEPSPVEAALKLTLG